MWDVGLIIIGMLFAWFISGWNSHFKKGYHVCPNCNYRFKITHNTKSRI